MGGQRFFEQPTVTARLDEPGEEFGVVAVTDGLAEEPHHRALALSDVGFDTGEQFVRDVRRGFSSSARHAQAGAKSGSSATHCS